MTLVQILVFTKGHVGFVKGDMGFAKGCVELST